MKLAVHYHIQNSTISCLYPEPSKVIIFPPPLCFFKIHFKITLLSIPGFLKPSLSCRCYHLNLVCISHLPHNCHIFSQSYPPWFEQLYNTQWTVQVTKHFTKHFSPVLCYFLPPRPNCFPQPMFERPGFTPTTFHKQLEVWRVAEWLWDSQQVLCSMEQEKW
jgi:hypothetical protein